MWPVNMLALNIDLLQVVSKFYYPFLRITGLLLYAPIFSSNLIPVRIRIVFSLVLAWLIYNTIDVPYVDIFSARGILLALTQILVGLIFAFTLQMAFQAVTIAGEAISMSMGLAFAQIVDPSNGHSVPLLSQLFLIFITLYFVTMDMHLLIVQVITLSFVAFPISDFFNAESLYGFVLSSAVMFAGAIIIAMPILATLLSINIIMGVMSRAAPQLNIFTVGFPMTLFLGYVAILFFIAEIISAFDVLLRQQFVLFNQTLSGAVF